MIAEDEFSPAFSTAFDADPNDPCAGDSCVPWQACMDCCDGWDDLDPNLQGRATTLAWDAMRVLSGGLVGACEVELRPCLTSAPCMACSDGSTWLSPYLGADGNWRNCARLNGSCSCCTMCEIVFPGRVADVSSVVLDGVEIDRTAFRIDNGNRLVREDGECWPECQDMGAPAGDPGTLVIKYTPGVKPDAAGLWAAGILACEFSKACSGGKCRLPSRVTSVVRQGITMDLSSSMFENGTGIREVDAYIESLNPNQLRTPPTVWSPSLAQGKSRVTTWRA